MTEVEFKKAVSTSSDSLTKSMITAKIYAHARETPDKTAIFYNRRKISYRLFASLIERSRQYLAAQGVGGEGVAVLPTGSILNTYVNGLALRSLGLATLVVSSRYNLADLRLPEIRYVVVVAGESRPGLEHLCASSGWRFINAPADIYADDAESILLNLSEPEGRFGGVIVLTSGTTGDYKKVLFSPETETALVSVRRHCESFESVIGGGENRLNTPALL